MFGTRYDSAPFWNYFHYGLAHEGTKLTLSPFWNLSTHIGTLNPKQDGLGMAGGGEGRGAGTDSL